MNPDTHVNGPDKSVKRSMYTDLQHEAIRQELESFEGDIHEIQKQIEDGNDPRLLSTWKAPIELKIKQPSRGAVIMLGRRARAKQFGNKEGRKIVHAGYTDNGLLPTNGGAHAEGAEYLMYSERVRRSSDKRSTAKWKKKDKAVEKVSKEKKELTTFVEAMPNCGIWMEDEHVWDPDEVDEGDLAGS